jgi:anti-anti-sigma factor
MQKSGTPVSVDFEDDIATVHIENYLNKPAGEQIEKVCLQCLNDGYRTLILDFARTELVNSIGISFLLGVIDACEKKGADIIFSHVHDDVLSLFQILGITRKVKIDFASLQ